MPLSPDDEAILSNGPINCPWKDHDNAPICKPGCDNFEAIRGKIISFFELKEQVGQPVTIADIVKGLQTGQFYLDMTGISQRGNCAEQPRIPVETIQVYQPTRRNLVGLL